MVDRKTVRVVVIVLVVAVLVQLLAGVKAGLRQDWMKMSFMLFGSCLSVFFVMNVVAGWRIITSLSRLEELGLERTDYNRGEKCMGCKEGNQSDCKNNGDIHGCRSGSQCRSGGARWLASGPF